MVGGEKKNSKTKTKIKVEKIKENKINLPTTLVNTKTEKKIPSMNHLSKMTNCHLHPSHTQFICPTICNMIT